MPTPRIDELVLLMDRAFADSEHSLLRNLLTVHPDSWGTVPLGGRRSIREITLHVRRFKFMYANHGFRSGDLDYSEPPATPASERLATIETAIEWLREGHAYLTGCVNELPDDSELDVDRKAHWGEPVPARHIIVTMIEHDLYHAGEINRTRALLQDDDGWFTPDRRVI